MRRGNKPEFIFSESNQLVGVSLGSDFCAEHEWGIEQIKKAFGVSSKIEDYGLVRRKISRSPITLAWVEYVKEGKDLAGFVYRSWYHSTPVSAVRECSEISFWRGTLAAAWSEDDFAIVSSDATEVKHLKTIYEQFASSNIIIMLSGKEFLKNPGLVIGIADRLPKNITEDWEKADKDYHELREEFEASGIEEILRVARKHYYALSPRRKPDGSIHYWLNPTEQNDNNFGWFTLSDLLEWSKNTGKIPKKKNDGSKR